MQVVRVKGVEMGCVCVGVWGEGDDVGSNGTGSRYSRRWVGCKSIWLNRNGGGDIFKPGKVWCLAVRGGSAAGCRACLA